MYFEDREIKAYGDFIRASDLVVADVYFRVSYLDEDMLIPEMVPLVFIGRNLDPEQPGLYFQDAGSYLAGERYEPANDRITGPRGGFGGWLETMPEDEFSNVFEFERGLDSLLACSLRRRN